MPVIIPPKTEEGGGGAVVPETRGISGRVTVPGVDESPFEAGDDKGLFREFFEPEIGGVQDILSMFTQGEAAEILTRQVESRKVLADLLLTLPEGEQKERVKEQVRKSIETGSVISMKELVPAAGKTPSQIFGEVFSLGLLVTPLPEIKALRNVSIARKFLVGGAMGAPFGAALGLAQEGEIKEKIPAIAAMTGLGFVGSGILVGVLPSLVKSLGVKSVNTIKNIWRKVIPAKPGVEDKLILPVVKYAEQRIGKVKTERVVKVGVQPIETKINKLSADRIKNFESLDSLILNDPILLPKPGVGRPAEIVTKKTLAQHTERITFLNKEITKLEKQKESLVLKSAQRGLKEGDEIFSIDVGRIKVQSFLKDENGVEFMTGLDINGRMVTVLPDDLAKMKKIVQPPTRMVKRFEGLPELPREPVEVGKVNVFLNGVKRYLKSAQPFVAEFGEAGKQYTELLSKTINEIDRKKGSFQVLLKDMVKKLGLDKKGTELTRVEMKNIVDILDAGLREKATSVSKISVKPINQRVKEFLDTSWDITRALVTEGDEIGLQVRDRTTGKKHSIGEAFIHFPHIPKDIKKLRKAIPELVELQMKRKNLTRQQANVLVNSFVKNFSTNRYAGLEQSRSLFIQGFDELEKFGYEVNPLIAIEDFINGASRRIVEARNLGIEDEIVARLIADIRTSGYDSGLAQELWNRYTGDRGLAVTEKAFSQAIRTFQVVAKLPLAGIINATQIVNPVTEFGVKHTAIGFKNYFFKRVESREAAFMAGVVDDVVSRAVEMAGGTSEIATKFLRNVGFTGVEKFNRIVTVGASQSWAESSLRKLQKNFNNPKLQRHFKQMGVDTLKAVKRGRWTQEELNIIGQAAVNSTQFRYSVLDLPLFWSSPQGKITTQFKSFVWQQGSFIKRVIIDEMRHGNMHPLITYLLASQIAGEGVKDFRSVLKGDFDFRTDMGLLERLIDNQFSVGGFGLAGELFDRFYLIAKGNFFVSTAELIAGPTAGDIAESVDSLAKAFAGSEKSLVKFLGREASLLSLIPVLGNIPGSGAFLRVLGDILAEVITEE